LKFHKHETGRRNFALIQWSRARMRLNEVLRRVKVSSTLADESLQQAEAWKVEAEDRKVKAEKP
nr:hypothetical protein [Tanacetum cinerariifolium]